MMIIKMKMTTDDGKCSCARHIGAGGGYDGINGTI